MADLWLNTFHGYVCDVDEQPHCSRESGIGESDNVVQDNAMDWCSFGKEVPDECVMDRFRVLVPKSKDGRGFQEELVYGYEWVALMVHAVGDREVYEAAVLLLCALGSNKFSGALIANELEGTEVYGYSVQALLDIIGRVLIPNLMIRLKQLIVAFVQAQDLSKPLLKKGLSEMDYSYDEYLRIRNIHGFVEGGLLVCLAGNGVTGEGLSVGVAGDITEACILTHDSFGVLYKDNNYIANIHHYANGSLNETLSNAFFRAAILNRRVREAEMPQMLKRALLSYSSSYYLLTFSSKLYGYGSSYNEAMRSSMKAKRHLNSLETVHHNNGEKGAFDQMLSMANSLKK